MKFTNEQRAAIETRGMNLLVSAAAGSGKTAVLVERILALVEEGASLENMLIVTFTRAAAAEMRARIQKALGARLRDARLEKRDVEDKAGERLARLRKEYEAVSRAQIRTLHSFCEWMLRQYFTKADVPPSFRVDDGTLLCPARERAMEEAIDAALKGKELAFARLCEIDFLPELAERVYEFLWNQPEPERFVEDALAIYRGMCEDYNASVHADVVRTRMDALYKDAEMCIKRAMEICAMEGGPAHYLDILKDDLLVIDDARTANAAEFARLPAKRAECDEALKEAAQELRLKAKESVKAALELSGGGGAVAVTRAREMLPSLEALLSLTLDFEARYREKKLAEGILEFSDLEHRALCALRDAGVRESIREKFDYVFIDEYQDINPLQEAVLEGVSRKDNRFMVGDVKQSIYRFRQADPTIFLNLAECFSDEKDGKRIDLNKNFRSQAHILDAVNHLFAQVMKGGAAEIEYDERAALIAGREREESGACSAVEVLIVETGKAESAAFGEDTENIEGIGDEVEREELSAAEKEAKTVAEKILRLIGTPVPDESGGTRPAKPGDIAILLRSPSGVAHIYTRALEKVGVRVSADVGVALFSSPEVMAFRDLLAAIENRRDDSALLGAMRSVGEFSSNDLALIRAGVPKGSFFDAAIRYANERVDELAERVRTFLERLLAWRERSRRIPLSDFVYLLLEETDRERIAALLHRETELAHLKMLCAGAAALPDGTIGDFLRLIDRKRFAGDDAGPGMSVISDDAVRLMSVHKSKGLEFPIVIGANLGRRWNQRDAGSDFLMSRKLGFGIRFKDETVSFRAETSARQAIRLEMDALSRAEELRVLYVLLTRARDRLILCGAVRDVGQAASKWAIGDADLFSAACPLDWIAPTLMRHPDGGILREFIAGKLALEKSSAKYSFEIVRAEDVGIKDFEIDTQVDRDDDSILMERTDEEIISDDWKGILEFQYSFQEAMPQKTSVSASLNAQRKIAKPSERPEFLYEKRELTPAQRGSAMHAAMRALDFTKLKGLDKESLLKEIAVQLDAMEKERLMNTEQRKGLSADGIASFFTSALGQEALDANILYREQPFNLRVDVDDNIRLMQGIIDLCYVRTNGFWVVVDYKTDKAFIEPEDVRTRHADQLRQYANALEALTGRSVEKMAVFLFATGEAIEI